MRECSSWLYRGWVLVLCWVVGLVGCGLPSIVATAPRAEILWDKWGVPHIFAQDDLSLLRAFGWAQMQSHRDLLLRLYAQARGRGAEFFGPTYLTADQTMRLLDIPTLGDQWYTAQSPTFRRHVDAFVAGINAYVAQYPEQIAPLQALFPITGADVFRHWARLVALFAVENSECRALLPGLSLTASTQRTADGWAIAPAHTVAGHTLLLTGLHWPWDGELTLYEAQLAAPSINLSGAALVGLPTLFVGFNDHLGWTHTVSRIDRCDLYALTPANAALTDGYRIDGHNAPFTNIADLIQVAASTGGRQFQPYVRRQTAMGPVVTQGARQFAVRLAGLTTLPMAHLLEQWWAMGKAKDWAAFQQASTRPTFFNLLYADEAGRIAAFAGGNVPQRPAAVTDWSLPAPGERTSLLWHEVLPAHNLPQVIDPAAGWVQSSSGTPWYLTWPPLLPANYPRYGAPTALSAPPEFLREQRALTVLTRGPATLTTLAAATTDTHVELAARILDDVIAAAEQSDSMPAQAAATVLARWDRRADAASRGMALFAFWYRHWVAQTFMKLSAANPMLTGAEQLMDSELFYASGWQPQAPLTTPQGLFSTLVVVRALESAVDDLQQLQLPLDAPWHAVARLQRDQADLPGGGGDGVLGIPLAIDFAPNGADTSQAVAGASYLAVVEFSQPVRALALMSYGNASQTDSPHRRDQLVLVAQQTLRPVLRTRAAIEAQLAERTLLTTD